MDIAGRNKAQDKDSKPESRHYISVAQLKDIVLRLGLGMTNEEIEILASGFASNGKGSIDAKEFCEMIRSLMYNLIGSHHAHGERGGRGGDYEEGSGSSGSFFGRSSFGIDGGGLRSSGNYDQRVAKEQENTFLKEFSRLLRDCCESILKYDRKYILGNSSDFYRTLLKSFIEIDYKGNGFISFSEFVIILKEMGCLLSRDEFKILAKPFIVENEEDEGEGSGPYAESSYPSSHLNHLESFRNVSLTGTLSGKMKHNSKFSQFLSSNGLKHRVSSSIKSDLLSLDHIHDDSLIYYSDFVSELVKLLEQFIEKKGGLPVLSASKLPWVIKEFELVDLLLSQLESMNAMNRRKTLITLQYALENADINQVKWIDLSLFPLFSYFPFMCFSFPLFVLIALSFSFCC
jgi:Ca2+-binding EF-hand superfamily protein